MSSTRPVKATILRRYTDLPAAITTLLNREVTLLSPATWDDRNDRETMESFARASSLKTLLAVCFSQSIETYHLWKVFAPGPAGVCIEFFKEALLGSVTGNGFTHELVKYQSPAELFSSYSTIYELPFVKSKPYQDEKEYRIIYRSDTETLSSKSFPVDLSVVRAVTLSPWLAAPVFKATKASILAIPGCSGLPVVRSPVVSNQAWLKYVAGNA